MKRAKYVFLTLAATLFNSAFLMGEEREEPLAKILLKAREFAEAEENKYMGGVVLRNIAVLQAELGHTESAILTAEMIPRPYDTALALIEVAEARIDAQDRAGAERILGNAEKRISAIGSSDFHLKSNGLAHLAAAYVRMGNLKKARSVRSSDSKDDFFGDNRIILLSMAKKQAFEEEIQDAVETLSRIGRLRAWDKKSLAIELVEAGKIDASVKMAKAIMESHVRDLALAEIVGTLAKKGNVNEAIRIIDGIEEGRRARAWRAVVEAHLTDDVPLSESMLEKATEAARQSHDAYDKATGLGRIASALARRGEAAEARILLKEALESAGETDNNSSLLPIAEAYAGLGDPDKAKEIAVTAGDWYKDEILRFVGREQARQGCMDDALKTLSEIEGDVNRAKGLAGIAEIQRKKGKKEDARRLLRKSHDLLVSIRGALSGRPLRDRDPKLVLLDELIKAQIALDDLEGSLHTVETVRRDYGALVAGIVFVTISQNLAARSDFGSVANILGRERDPLVKARILLGVMKGIRATPGLDPAKLDRFVSELDEQQAGGTPEGLKALVKELNEILGKDTIPYCDLLWSIQALAQKVCAYAEWPLVRSALESGGIGVEGSDRSREKSTYRCILRKSATKVGQNGHFDCWIEFTTGMRTSKSVASKEVVSSVVALLVTNPRVPHAVLIEESSYGGLVGIQDILAGNEVEQAVSAHPIVERVEISASSEGEIYVTLTFSKKAGGAEEGKRLSFSLGLLGKSPKYRVGSIRSHGSSSWSGGKAGELVVDKGGEGASKPDSPAAFVFALGDLKTLSPDVKHIVVVRDELTDEDLKVLSRFKALEILDLGKCDSLGNDSLAHIAAVSTLKELRLSGKNISGGIDALLALKDLRGLHISWCSSLPEKSYSVIAGLRSLQNLTLWWSAEMSDEALEKLSDLPQLRELSLWGCPDVTDEGLVFISRLSNLQEFSISHSKGVTSDGIVHLKELSDLIILRLGYMSLDNRCLEHLGSMKSLRRLSLHGLDLTDDGLEHLKGLENVVWLYIQGCHGVSEKALAKLKAHFSVK